MSHTLLSGGLGFMMSFMMSISVGCAGKTMGPGSSAPLSQASSSPSQDLRVGNSPGRTPSVQLTGAELETWNDPSFKQQYAQSYLAETDIEPRVTGIERQRLQDILELIAANKADVATALLEKKRDEAASAVFDFTLANLYFQREDLAKAVQNYQIAVQKYPKFRRAWRNLGLSAIRQNEFDQARVALTRVVELGGGDAITYGLLGFAYAAIDNHTAAESAYRNAILLDASTLDWKLGLARSFFKRAPPASVRET